uniref:Uncharacterized protein n=1 Tax=Anguilla anguilla TaxID=7936 RepID=A0A0E9PQZ5_ANGAN
MMRTHEMCPLTLVNMPQTQKTTEYRQSRLWAHWDELPSILRQLSVWSEAPLVFMTARPDDITSRTSC